MLRASATAAPGIKAGLLACALLLLAAPAAWAGAWLPPQDLSAPGRSATNPVVAMADDGATTALWEKDNTKPRRVPRRGRHPRARARPSPPPRNWSPGVTDPQIEMTGGGQTIAVWKRLANPPGNYVIEAATRPPGGAFGPPMTVAEMPTGGDPERPPDGAQRRRRRRRRLDPDRPRIGGRQRRDHRRSLGPPGRRRLLRTRTAVSTADRPQTESALNAGEPSVAIDAAGDVTVVWRYNDGTDQVIEASERPAGGTFSTPEVISGAGDDSFEPQVAIERRRRGDRRLGGSRGGRRVHDRGVARAPTAATSAPPTNSPKPGRTRSAPRSR